MHQNINSGYLCEGDLYFLFIPLFIFKTFQSKHILLLSAFIKKKKDYKSSLTELKWHLPKSNKCITAELDI